MDENYENSISSDSSDFDIPILKSLDNKNPRSSLLPLWFQEMNQKYELYSSKVEKIQDDCDTLTKDLRKFDEKKEKHEKEKKANKEKNTKNVNLSSLNSYLLFEISLFLFGSTGVKGDLYGIRRLIALMNLNRVIKRKLDCEKIWRVILIHYLGEDFVLLNDKNFEKESKKFNNREANYWKRIAKYFLSSFSNCKKSLNYYRSMYCPSRIEHKSVEKDLISALKFIKELKSVFYNNSLKQIGILILNFLEFLEDSKTLYCLKRLCETKNMFTHSDAIEVLTSISNLKLSIKQNLKEFNLKKYISNKSKLYTNKEQELNLILQFRLLYLFDLPKLENLLLDEDINPFSKLENELYYNNNILLLNYTVYESDLNHCPPFFLNNFICEEKLLNNIKDVKKNIAIAIWDQYIRKQYFVLGMIFLNSKNQSILIRSNENSENFVQLQGDFKTIKKNERKNLQTSAVFNNGVFMREMNLYSGFILSRKDSNDFYERKLVFYASDFKHECFLVIHILD